MMMATRKASPISSTATSDSSSSSSSSSDDRSPSPTSESSSTPTTTTTSFSTARQKGDLIFESNFESGNLAQAVLVSENAFAEYDLSIRPDSNNASYRLWFYFSVKNVARNQRVIFNIVNFSKTKSLYRLGMSPVVRSSSRPYWERLPEKYVFYYRCPRYKKNYVLSFLFQFDRESDVYSFAYCFPYTYTDLQQYLHHCEIKNHCFFRRELLCRTILGRRLDLLTITSPSNLEMDSENNNNKKKKIIFLTARVHPGESPSSFIAHGIIDFLLSDDPQAKLLRDNLIFKIVPQLNPDGVFLGNYRCSSLGFDLNRNWLSPNWAHPTIKATRDLITKLNETHPQQLEFFIDIHAHSNATNSFMFVNCSDASEAEKRDKQLLFPRLLDARSKVFSLASTRYNAVGGKDSGNKIGTGRRALDFLELAPHCYTLEVSFFCSLDAKMKPVPFTQEAYMTLGKDLLLSFIDFYNLSGSNNNI